MTDHEAKATEIVNWLCDEFSIALVMHEKIQIRDRISQALRVLEEDRDGWKRTANREGNALEKMRTERDALAERVRGLPRWNCDCLPAGDDGQPSDGPDAIYTERDVVLASDLDAVLPPTRREGSDG